MNELLLKGCRTEPLGSYLKALGVLRLVGEQADPEARGHWRGDTFVLTTNLDRDALTAFFLDQYAPTPVVSPWNNGSGFKSGGSSGSAEKTLALIESSGDPRLRSMAETIGAARSAVLRGLALGWGSSKAQELWDKRHKAAFVASCRSTFPDDSVRWIDATIVLADEPVLKTPILGTGGNLGRLELSANYMGHVVSCLGIAASSKQRAVAAEQFAGAIFDEPVAELAKGSGGQFGPGSVGGPNSSPGGRADALVNPWDFVLTLEGAMLFASSAARRLDGQAKSAAAVPFSFSRSPVGYASANDAENASGEVWAPVWRAASRLPELVRLIGEGRAEWRGGQARNGLDAARSLTTLGVDRGIESFHRFAFVERDGQSPVAIPVGRVDVRERPAVALTGALDGWYDRVRRGANAPGSVTSGVASVERALFESTRDDDPRSMQTVLLSVAALERSVGRAERFRDAANVRPVEGLKAADWLPVLDDTTPEFRVAAAVASLRDADGSDLRALLRPITRTGRSVDWSVGPEPVVGLGSATIVGVLAAALAKRSIDVGRSGRSTDGDQVGVQPAFQYGLRAPMADIALFALGELDDSRLGRLFEGLLLLDWSPPMPRLNTSGSGSESVSAAWSILAPFFHGKPIRLSGGAELSLIPEASWPSLLAADRTEAVIAAAIRRMRAARLQPVFERDAAHRIAESTPPGERLAAALLVPVSSSAISQLVQQSVYQAQ